MFSSIAIVGNPVMTPAVVNDAMMQRRRSPSKDQKMYLVLFLEFPSPNQSERKRQVN